MIQSTANCTGCEPVVTQPDVTTAGSCPGKPGVVKGRQRHAEECACHWLVQWLVLEGVVKGGELSNAAGLFKVMLRDILVLPRHKEFGQKNAETACLCPHLKCMYKQDLADHAALQQCVWY